MAFFLAPSADARPQFFTSQGAVLAGGFMYWYAAGTTTPQDTFTTSAGSVANANPITLDAAGRPSTGIYLTEGVGYKLVVKDSALNTIFTQDNVVGITTALTNNEWSSSGLTPTYISATSFSLPGDQTTDAHVNRRLKIIDSGGTKYGTISASTFSTLTTVVVLLDNGALANPISSVSYSILTKTSDALPRQIFPTIPQIKGYISGLTYANNVSDATNDIDIASGVCVDATAVDTISVSAITKQSDAVWAVGTSAGGLDLLASAGNNDFYIWAIKRIDTQVTDVLFSLSSTAPTMPANYTLKRLIGWFKRVGGTIVAFHTYETEGGGLEMNWDAPTLDINQANTLTTARRTDAVKVPLNFSVVANLNFAILDAASTALVQICCPDQTDAAPSLSAAPLATIFQSSLVSWNFNYRVRTSAAGLIAARATVATVDLYAASTQGFTWARRN